MILTDREIQAALAKGAITIDPAPNIDSYSSSSLDLTLAPEVIFWKDSTPGVEQIFSPGDPSFDYPHVSSVCSRRETMGADGVILEPGKLMLAWTTERVALPTESGLAARVEGKSALARLGLCVHNTAPTVHCGFSGTIQLEICNHGPLKVRLHPGMRICQLIFEQTYGTPAKGYMGQFKEQKRG